MRKQFFQPALDGKAYGIVACRHHDATPALVRFGRLTGKLQPSARYLIKVEGRWQALPFEEFRELTGCRSAPNSGVVEMLGICADIHWCMKDPATTCEKTYHRDILVMPKYLKSTNASTQYAAVKDSIPCLSDTDIFALCAVLRFMILTEGVDNCSATLRKLGATGRRLPENCLMPPAGCTVHRCHRIMVSATREDPQTIYIYIYIYTII